MMMLATKYCMGPKCANFEPNGPGVASKGYCKFYKRTSMQGLVVDCEGFKGKY